MPLIDFRVAGALALLLLSACGQAQQPQQAAAPPPAVTVVKVATENVRPSSTFTGRVLAKDTVELRARVDGFLEKRLFVEGSNVKDGDLLFVIEKGLYQAAVEEAKAGVETAEATLKLTELDLTRQRELVQRSVAAQAKLDEVSAKQGEAQGNLLAQKAALDKAKLQLSYTDIVAPLTGRIGRAHISVGNFVGPSSGTLATIVSQNPIYVTFPVTQREILEFRKRGDADPSAVTVYLELADDTRYPIPGKVDFVDVTANPGTDTVLVRAIFANPDGLLVSGQLVSVVAETGPGQNLVVVPGQSLQLDQAGAFVLVVDKDSKVQVRRVDIGSPRGTNMIVLKGLEPGERVVSEGIQRVRPGQVVTATEARPPGA
jgi:membrane fusion protein (multidrug efflux system)